MIDYTLGLASPLVVDPRVKRAQGILNGGNVFGEDFLAGKVDGEFGRGTGRACVHAKDWIGYPDKDLLPFYGPTLDALLLGERVIPPEFKKRTAARRKKKTSLRAKALADAITHIGQTEHPANSNHVEWASVWYGLDHQPWCAMGVTRWYVDAGSKAFVKGHDYSYVPNIVNDARAGRNFLRVTKEPLPGDVVTYNWDGGVADHVGVFEAWLPGAEGSEFHAIEGNTSSDDHGSQSNGGGCYRRVRRIAQVECFVRVGR